VALLALFVAHERRIAEPMLPLELFARRNFTFGNLQTFAMYGGLGAMFFFLTLFLQQVAGYEALEAGIATIPTTLVMFALSKRAGRLADRFGPRLFMGCGPLVGAVGVALMLRLDEDISYWTELFPALLIFSLGLVATVTPLTATVLADADEHNAGIASGVNNAIARVAGLLCVAAIGAAVSAVYAGDMGGRDAGETLAVIPGVAASVGASVHAFHVGVGVCAVLVAAGGVLGLVGIRNPRRIVRCEDCAEGAHSVSAPHTPLGREPAAATR
jgi:predicted MFS family arabinose efflux permease